MKLLHYFLGFPPYRTGGLTKYAMDLMQAQTARGDKVFALWPGTMGFFQKKVRILSQGSQAGIARYMLQNPLPVALDEGVAHIEAYTAGCDRKVFLDFLKQLRPDAIHIHTLMGLYREFVLAAEELGIPTVFTTHDYYGLCPKVTMYRGGNGPCPATPECSNCAACNQGALSLQKIRILQSPLYRCLKNTPLVQQLRKRHRQSFFAEPERVETSAPSVAYQALRAYYVDMLSHITTVHFNSTVAQQVYTRFFTPKRSILLPITHSGIADCRNNPHIAADRLRLTYLSPAKPFKGYGIIRQALDSLWQEGERNFVLRVFSPVQDPAPYMEIQEEGYAYGELPEIFANTDILLAPSVWQETFGFTVLEALSFGVPVLVSDNVGAKDIVGQAGVCVPPADPTALASAVRSLTESRLLQLRQAAQEVAIPAWREFVTQNDILYQ